MMLARSLLLLGGNISKYKMQFKKKKKTAKTKLQTSLVANSAK